MRIKKINEFNNNDYVNELTELESDYLISVTGDFANIDKDIFILLGYNPHSNYNRIKVSPDKNNRTKTFSIDVDRLVVLGDYDKNIVTKNVIENLFRWIKINIDIIHDLSKEDTDIKLINKLRKIN